MNGLYIHIPFCVKKCAYCDFYSVPFERSLAEGFIAALKKEIELRSADAGEGIRFVDTIFFGGGTPSLLPPGRTAAILESLHRHFQVSENAEITLETNPGTVDARVADELIAAGINRFSIGIQSFRPAELTLLGRIHTAAEAEAAVRLLRSAGCDTISIDLIYGLPDQTLEQWRETLERALLLEPDHISAYSLTWNNGTVLGRAIQSGRRPAPEEDRVADMFLKTGEMLAAAGYHRYEVSNFAKPGYECVHNLGYWTGGNYLGLGPSAHSFSGRRRFWNISNVTEYIDVLSQHQLPVEGSETLDNGQRRLEQLALTLRTDLGVPLELIPAALPVIERLSLEKLGTVRNGRFVLNETGFLLADEITLMLSADNKESRTG